MDGEGFSFFKGRSDRSIPHEELMALARESISANGFVLACGLKDMLVVGYSSGPLFGTALLALAPENFVGAILLRPQPISDDFTFPELSGKPVLIISGLHDNRREPQHASQVAEQLIAANAVVTHHVLDSGHGWAANDDDSCSLVRGWMRTSNLSFPYPSGAMTAAGASASPRLSARSGHHVPPNLQIARAPNELHCSVSK